MRAIEVGLAAAWAALVVAVALRRRPTADRVWAPPPRPARPAAARRRPDAPAVAIGAFARRLLGGRSLGVSERALGCTVLAGGLGVVLLPPHGVLLGLPMWLAALARARRRPAALGHALTADVAEAVELLGVALSGGLSTRAALEEVCPWLQGPLRVELVRCLDRAELGWSLADELELLPRRLHPCTGPFAAVLVSAERYGAPIVPGLVRLGESLRADRRRQLEEAARRAPVRLLLPLIGGILPAFVLLAVVPLIVGALADIRGAR